MDAVLVIIQFGGPLILMIMGGIGAVRPPDRKNKGAIRAWIGAFVIVGVLISGASGYQRHLDRLERRNAKIAFETLEKKLTGEGNYAYLQVRPPKTYQNKYHYQLVGKGRTHRVNIGWYPLDKDGVPLREYWQDPIPVIDNTIVNQRNPIPEGRYRINFSADEGKWEQFWTLSSAHSVLEEIIEIRRDGKRFYYDANYYPIPWGPNGPWQTSNP